MDAREKRVDFQSAQQEVALWTKQADAHLKDDYDGVKYETAEERLEQHKVSV